MSVRVLVGDLFASEMQTWVNTVNCVGVMGRGVAKGFKERFPDMFADYKARCDRLEVQLGRPYLYRRMMEPWVLNFPTKDHWRSVSTLADIERGLDHLAAHLAEWQVTSLAVPPLGCGNGQLDWQVVGPVLYERLGALGIPVELYAPHGTPAEQIDIAFLTGEAADRALLRGRATGRSVEPGAFALVELLARFERERYREPVGRVMFQKMVYFATERGVPTGLTFEKASYGPFSPELKRLAATLINNGLIEERRDGRRFEIRVGPAYEAARATYAADLDPLDDLLDDVNDLLVRIRHGRRPPEIDATVHFAAHRLVPEHATEEDVVDAVETWKARRKPALDPTDIRRAVRGLNLLGWIDAEISPTLVPDALGDA